MESSLTNSGESMIQETTVQEQTVDKTLTPEEQAKADILAEHEIHEDNKGRPKVSKFGEVAPSEEELRGEVIEPQVKKEPEAVEAQKPSKDVRKTKPTVKEEPKAEESAEEKEEKPSEEAKPPKGYVKLEALHEARIINKALSAEVERLKRELEVLSSIPVESESEGYPSLPKDFKVLTEEEEDALMEEDITAYNRYLRDLRKYNQLKQAEEQEQAEIARITEASRAQMASIVPGLFDEDSEINAELTKFASEHGVAPAILSILTDPSVKIIIPGVKKPVSMGPAAVAIVDLLNRTYHKVSKASKDPAEEEKRMRETLTAQLTEEITKKVTKELMEKLSKQQTNFRSIGDVPAAGDIPSKTAYTEADFRRMTPEQRRAALGG